MNCNIHKQVSFLLEALELLTSKLIELHFFLLRSPTSLKSHSIIKISENNMERIPIIPQLQAPIAIISEPTFLEPLKNLLTKLSTEKVVVQRPCIN